MRTDSGMGVTEEWHGKDEMLARFDMCLYVERKVRQALESRRE